MSLTLIGPAYDEARQAREGAQGIQQALDARLPADRAERLDLRSAPRNAPVFFYYGTGMTADHSRYASASPEVTSGDWQTVLDVAGRGVLHAAALRNTRDVGRTGGTASIRVTLDGAHVTTFDLTRPVDTSGSMTVTTPLASNWFPLDAQVAFDTSILIEIKAVTTSGNGVITARAYWTLSLR